MAKISFYLFIFPPTWFQSPGLLGLPSSSLYEQRTAVAESETGLGVNENRQGVFFFFDSKV